MEALIVELELVGKLKTGDKLNVQDVVTIEHPHILSFITRWYYEDNRVKTSEYLQSLVVRTSEILTNPTTDISRVTRATYNAVSGVRCLIFTYATDLAFVTKLENIVQQFELLL